MGLDAQKMLWNHAGRGDEEGVRMALSLGADPDAKDESGWSAGAFAIMNRRRGICPELARAGANVDLRHWEGEWTLLMMAADNGDASGVEELLRLGADPRARDQWGQTAEQICLSHGMNAPGAEECGMLLARFLVAAEEREAIDRAADPEGAARTEALPKPRRL